MQNEQLQQVVKALKDANNVLVTVKNSPSVDELSAAVGLTLALNKADKHATTVFSGTIPSTIEFLQPEQVIETNTDSLRDFIIALDKSKADKLRYKVEDSVVRIFITPYRSSITEKDLEFSQGDFNVDVVIALGVVTKEDFDTAVTAHGRILHDATVIGITKQDAISTVGSLNWQEPRASSVSEMVSAVVDGIDPALVDGQMATAFLTGIVAETDRFKNDKTTPEVLSVGSRLMTAGANQQLIAEKLEEPEKLKPVTKIANHDPNHDDGSLEIHHEDDEVKGIHIDDNGNLGLAQYDQEDEKPPEQAPRRDIQELFKEEQQKDEVSREYIATPTSPNNAATQPNTVRPATEVEQPSLMVENKAPQSANAVVNAQQQPAGEQQSGNDSSSTPVDAMPAPAQEAQMPTMQHGHKVVQPVSDEFKQHRVDEPVAALPFTDDSLAALEQQIGSPHMEAQIPQEQPGVSQEEIEVAPVNNARPEALTSSTDTNQSNNENGPPSVPPPLMPPTSSQPQFFDADGKNSNPFTAK